MSWNLCPDSSLEEPSLNFRQSQRFRADAKHSRTHPERIFDSVTRCCNQTATKRNSCSFISITSSVYTGSWSRFNRRKCFISAEMTKLTLKWGKCGDFHPFAGICTFLLDHRELLQDQKSRAGALQASPLQNLLQNLLTVVQRSLCGEVGGGVRTTSTHPSNRKTCSCFPKPNNQMFFSSPGSFKSSPASRKHTQVQNRAISWR